MEFLSEIHVGIEIRRKSENPKDASKFGRNVRVES